MQFLRIRPTLVQVNQNSNMDGKGAKRVIPLAEELMAMIDARRRSVVK